MSASPSMVDELLAQLQGAPIQQMAQNLGQSEAQTQQAVQAAVPMMLGALGNNAQSAGGASALFEALQRDHAGAGAGAGAGPDLGGLLGSLLGGGGGGAQAGGLGGMLGSVLGGALGGGAAAGGPASAPAALDGASILGHIFGGQQDQATANLGQATGLGSNAGNLLKMLAPLVMSFLAQRVMSGGLNSSQLGNALGEEKAQVQQQGGLGGGLLGSLLDQNGDGKLDVSDLMKIGGSLLGGKR
ncbi:hypothetical protein M2375_001655 [Comamonas sp. BIGb0152]|uniref:DUF937 domain-containing protein n=1 Tax=Comamonas sp. BIGb0152 TaxID=2940601 RepID=UPI00216A9F32|nr:DUF937 domain-containing protein [Comamonas sp. BIGb0152]MCS4293438.1 hypothetical protein [Comamonas sp. BIGb0152]